MKFPVHGREECHLVGVDLAHFQAGDLTPGSSRVIAILQILRGQDESSQEHATTALKGSDGRDILGLFHGEIMLGHMTLDENQIVQGNLKRRVARPRTTQRLLNEGAQRQNTTTGGSLTPASRNRSGPDNLYHLSCRINKAVDKVDLAITLAL